MIEKGKLKFNLLTDFGLSSPSFLDTSSILESDDISFILPLIPPQFKMKKVFENGNFKQFKAAVEEKKAVLIICKTNKTSFGLLIVDSIILNGQWSSSSLISAFNILDRKEFTGKGVVRGDD